MKYVQAVSFIGVAHRVVWRYGIILWLGVIFHSLVTPVERSIWAALPLLIFFAIFDGFRVAYELRHPRPKNLGVSAPEVAGPAFAAMAGVSILGWLVGAYFSHGSYEVPWVIGGLLLYVIAFVIRPRAATR